MENFVVLVICFLRWCFLFLHRFQPFFWDLLWFVDFLKLLLSLSDLCEEYFADFIDSEYIHI